MCLKHLAGWRLLTLEAGAFRAELSGVRGRVQEMRTRVGGQRDHLLYGLLFSGLEGNPAAPRPSRAPSHGDGLIPGADTAHPRGPVLFQGSSLLTSQHPLSARISWLSAP